MYKTSSAITNFKHCYCKKFRIVSESTYNS